MNVKTFRKLLDEISSTTPIDTNASLAATETKTVYRMLQ